MKRIKDDGTPSFQGDIMLRRVETLPAAAQKATMPEAHGGKVIAHSETGHHHVVTGDVVLYEMPGDALTRYMVARGPVEIVHHRSADTHETLELYSDGEREVVWEIVRQREYVPKGWRRVED